MDAAASMARLVQQMEDTLACEQQPVSFCCTARLLLCCSPPAIVQHGSQVSELPS